MRAVSIDTHAFVKRITAVGMPEAQAEVLAETLADRPTPVSKGAVVESVEKLGRAVDRRLESVDRRLSTLEGGQSVLNENQLETNRALNAIMAHLGIAKP